jgi:hypothetical protein
LSTTSTVVDRSSAQPSTTNPYVALADRRAGDARSCAFAV